MEQQITQLMERYLSIVDVYFPEVHLTDVIEVIILTFLIYQIMIWIKNTKAWMLLKGIIVLAV